MDALCAQLRGNFGKDLAAKAVNGDATTDFGMSDIGGLQRFFCFRKDTLRILCR